MNVHLMRASVGVGAAEARSMPTAAPIPGEREGGVTLRGEKLLL
jgi:hypothetical protein